MAGPGRPKQFDDRIWVQLTSAEKRHVEMRARIEDTSISEVMRQFIQADMRQAAEEAASG
jgi:hypothetical protein